MTEKKDNIKKVHRNKPDLNKNAEGLEEKISSLKPKKLYTLIIDSKTRIQVPKEKCNKKYAEEYRQRVFCSREILPPQINESSKTKIDIYQLKDLYMSGLSVSDIAKQMSSSDRTIRRYLKLNCISR